MYKKAKKLREENERIKRENEEAIATMKRDQQAEIDRLKRQQDQQLKDADADRARKQHEKEVMEAYLL